MRKQGLPNILTILVCFALNIGAAQAATPSFRILPHSSSHDERYSLAWGCKGIPNNEWKNIANGDFTYFDSQDKNPTDFVVNYLVDQNSQEVLCELPNFHYWAINDLHPNRCGLEVEWSDDSGTLVASYSTRFSSRILAGYVTDGQVPKIFDLDRALESFARQALQKAMPNSYRASKDKLDFSCNELKHFPTNLFQLKWGIGVGKCDQPSDVCAELNIQFQLATDLKGNLTCKEIKILSVTNDRPGDQDFPTQQEADRRLNLAWQSLWKKTVPAHRLELKKSQIRWLSERDQIADPDERTNNVLARVESLKSWESPSGWQLFSP